MLYRLVLAASLALPLAAAAQPDPTAARLADLRLATAVRLALVSEVRTRPLDIDVTADAGTVALQGTLAPADRLAAASVARAVPGVLRLAGDADPVRPAAVTPREALPPAEPQVPLSSEVAVHHTVSPGETLFSLARRYGTTVEAVVRLNRLPDAAIRVGQRLRMR